MWGVCTPQYIKVYRVNHTTGSLVQDIFTNTIEHFEVCATRFIEKKQYIHHIWELKISVLVLVIWGVWTPRRAKVMCIS